MNNLLGLVETIWKDICLHQIGGFDGIIRFNPEARFGGLAQGIVVLSLASID